MPAPFTFAAFNSFCARLVGRPVLSLSDYLAAGTLPASPWVLLRFDVDYREAHAVILAERAARLGLRGSFYFCWRIGRFDLEALRAVAAAGHEVGYHFETLDTCRGDYAAAARLLQEHITLLRGTGLTIRTIAAHGSAPTATTYRRNLDLLIQLPGLLRDTDVLGETTLSVDFSQVVYISDAGWRWRRYTHYAPQVAGTHCTLNQALADLDAGRNLYLTFHPHQWFADPVRAHYFRTRQRLGGWLVPVLRRVHVVESEHD